MTFDYVVVERAVAIIKGLAFIPELIANLILDFLRILIMREKGHGITFHKKNPELVSDVGLRLFFCLRVIIATMSSWTVVTYP